MATHKRRHLQDGSTGERSWPLRVLTAAVCGLVAVLATGCGQDGFGSRGRLDATKLESQIEQALLKGDTFAGVQVACPDEVQAKDGVEFTCDANLPDGTTILIAVTQVDGKGSVEWHAQNVVTARELARLEDQIGAEIAAQLETDVTMDCGDDPAVVTEQLDCEATLGTGTVLSILLSIDPDTGNVKWESKGGRATGEQGASTTTGTETSTAETGTETSTAATDSTGLDSTGPDGTVPDATGPVTDSGSSVTTPEGADGAAGESTTTIQ